MSKRYFEFRDEKSSKFWEIEIKGKSFLVRYGRIGTNGQTNEKKFKTTEKANAEAEKVINSKLKKGYQEVGASGHTTTPTTHKIKVEKSEDEDLIEYNHKTNEPDILGVGASQEVGEEEGWQVFISAAEFVREEPLERKMRDLIEQALVKVKGVKAVFEEDREVWYVEGNADGKDLVIACVKALQAIHSELKKFIDDL